LAAAVVAAFDGIDVATATTVPAVIATQKSATISCVKGKIVKKVTAINPKCPTGYKKR